MNRVGEFYDAIDRFAPFSSAEKWDNVGLLVGGRSQAVSRALLALDLTAPVLEEAKRLRAELVITHHPVIFHPLTQLDTDSLVYRAAAAGIAVISAHTNLDLAEGGVNDALAARLQLQNPRPLRETGSLPSNDILENHALTLGRVGDLEQPLSAAELAAMVRERLGAAGLRYTAAPGEIRTVAVCGGSGGDLLDCAKARGAQALVTGDVKHDQILHAAELGVVLVDAGHFATENAVMEPLRYKLSQLLPGAVISLAQSCTDGMKYLA